MYIGYSRVSTSDQNPDLQLDALKKEECHQIFSDTASGAKTDRPGLDEALAFLRGGDTLVVWKLDRLGRSLKHLIEWPWSQVCMECPHGQFVDLDDKPCCYICRWDRSVGVKSVPRDCPKSIPHFFTKRWDY